MTAILERFTPEIPLRPGTTLIEASAGTGKTYSITGLYLRLLLEEGCEVRDILVVTFTEAATSELRERIRKGVRDHLAKLDPSDTRSVLRLRQALGSFDEAAIHTIHGFCQRTLQQFAFESGAPAELELLTDESALRDEVAQDFFTEVTHDLPLPVYTALCQGGFTATAVFALARKLSEGALVGVPPAPEGNAERLRTSLQAAFEHTRTLWATTGAAARALLLDVILASKLNAVSYKRHKIEADFETLAAFLETGEAGKSLEEALLRLSTHGFQTVGQKKGAQPPQHPFFDAVDTLREAFHGMRAESLSLLHRALAWIPAEMARRKAVRQAVSFGDLLSGVAAALTDPSRGPALAQAVRARYRWALIDEFQDTDPLQWAIFHTLFPQMFVIGDPKQAIYAFRGADLPTYLRAGEAASARYGLMRNYRSDAGVVAAVCRLFASDRLPLPFHVKGIGFAEVEADHPPSRLMRGREGAPPDEAAAPLVFRTFPRAGAPLKKGTTCIESGFIKRSLPEIVAADVLRALESGWQIRVTGAGEPPRWRSVTPRDVAILVRTNTEAQQMKMAVGALGIPAVLQSSGSVFCQAEAADLLQVLRGLSEPTRLPSLRAALATALLGEPAERIAALAGAAGESTDEDSEAFAEWSERFLAWHKVWHRLGFMVAFRRLVSEAQVMERVLGEPDGERRMTNLLHLAELLHTAERQQSLKPHGLLAWLEQEITRAGDGEGPADDERQLRLESDADALQIVTMHRSKGLEYGLVFLPSLWAGGSLHPAERRHPRYPLDTPVGDARTAIYLCGDEAARDVALARAEQAQREENLRLLYVALTRARHRLFVYWGAVQGAGDSPLAYVLHPSKDGAFATVAAAFAGLSDEQIEAELAPLGRVEPCDWGGAPTGRYSSGRSPAGALAAREFPKDRSVEDIWRRESFTGLTRGAEHGRPAGEALAPGLDEPPEAPIASGLAAGGERVALADLPHGRGVGLCLHRALEKVEFDASPADVEAAAREALKLYGLNPELLGPTVGRALVEVLETPLLEEAPDLRLRGVGRARRLSELRFDLSVARSEPVSARAVGAALALRPELSDYGRRVAELGFEPFRGFLNGSLDLVFEHDGRYWLADYKSNHLGPEPADYTPARLAAVMADSHYHLQSHLYAVALHTWLRHRIGAAYDPERHFGGCLFLFLRGMHPARGPATGVFRDRPPIPVLEALRKALGVP